MNFCDSCSDRDFWARISLTDKLLLKIGSRGEMVCMCMGFEDSGDSEIVLRDEPEKFICGIGADLARDGIEV